MSVHDPRATLRQIQDAAGRLQMICAGKTKEQLLADWLATAALERFLEIVGGRGEAAADGFAVTTSVRAVEGNRRHARPFESRI